MRFLMIFLFLILAHGWTRAVSYPDGWTLMQRNNQDRNRLHIHYSPTAFTSLGWVLERSPGWIVKGTPRFPSKFDDLWEHLFQWNQLLFRLNTIYSQMNVYSKIGVGVVVDINESSYFPKGDISVAGDFETRRFFVSYDIGGEAIEKVDSFALYHKARLGIAPYVADFGSLHTWLMIQASYNVSKDNTVFTPIVRLFFSYYLLEVGMSHRGEPVFNFIVRF